MQKNEEYIYGRGAQYNPKNPYFKNEVVQAHWEGIDEDISLENPKTQYIEVFPKTIINKVTSPDIGPGYSMNPYQGCEHGCLYCYARNSHQYWGYSAGLDFEQKILVKKNAAELLEKAFQKKNWKPLSIMLSGNTDCYQPIERKLKITREILKVCLKYRHPVGIITKNALVLRDLDILKELAKWNLVRVNITVTTLDEDLRLALEPRTASCKMRLKAVEQLSKEKIPVNVMMAPIIPGLNSHEIFSLLKKVSQLGAVSAYYTMIRLNGSIAEVFMDWVRKSFPDRADKVIHQIMECHSGKLNDSRYGTRMRGEGKIAESISKTFKLAKKKYFSDKTTAPLNYESFVRNDKNQLKLF